MIKLLLFFLFIFCPSIFAKPKNNNRNPIKSVEASPIATSNLKIDLNEDDVQSEDIKNKSDHLLNQTPLKLNKKKTKNKKLTPAEVEAQMYERQERNNVKNKLNELEEERQRLEIEKLKQELELLEYVKKNQREDTRLKQLEIKEKEKIKLF